MHILNTNKIVYIKSTPPGWTWWSSPSPGTPVPRGPVWGRSWGTPPWWRTSGRRVSSATTPHWRLEPEGSSTPGTGATSPGSAPWPERGRWRWWPPPWSSWPSSAPTPSGWPGGARTGPLAVCWNRGLEIVYLCNNQTYMCPLSWVDSTACLASRPDLFPGFYCLSWLTTDMNKIFSSKIIIYNNSYCGHTFYDVISYREIRENRPIFTGNCFLEKMEIKCQIFNLLEIIWNLLWSYTSNIRQSMHNLEPIKLVFSFNWPSKCVN